LFRDDDVVALGFVGVVLGLPLFLAACLANYLILRRVPAATPVATEDEGETRAPTDERGTSAIDGSAEH
jgi:hypothetical protein